MRADQRSTGGPSRHIAGAYALFAAVGYWMQFLGSWRWSSVRTDSAIFRLAGQAVLNGSPIYEFRYLGYGWTYPPFGALVMAPLGLLPLSVVRFGGVLVALAALTWIVQISFHRLIRRGATRLQRGLVTFGLVAAVLPLAPVFETISIGQIGLFLMLAVLLDVRRVGAEDARLVGVLTGLAAAVKLLPGIFIVYWLFRRQWREFRNAAVAFIACWTLAAAVLREDTITYFTQGYLFSTSDRMAGAAESTVNQSLRGTFDRLLPSAWAGPAWVLAAGAVVCLALLLARRAESRGDYVAVAAVLGLASVLASPVSWVNHGVWIVPALATLVRSAHDRVGAVLAITCAVPALIATALVWQSPFSEYFVVLYLVLFACLAIYKPRPITTVST